MIVNQQWLHLSVLSSVPEAFVARNQSLDYLRGTLGFSYMCRERQTLGVTPDLTINTFQVHVQPFGVTGKQFAAGKFWLDEQKMIINWLTTVLNWGWGFLCVSQLKNASWMKITCWSPSSLERRWRVSSSSCSWPTSSAGRGATPATSPFEVPLRFPQGQRVLFHPWD